MPTTSNVRKREPSKFCGFQWVYYYQCRWVHWHSPVLFINHSRELEPSDSDTYTDTSTPNLTQVTPTA